MKEIKKHTAKQNPKPSQASAEEPTGPTLTAADTYAEPFMTKRSNQKAIEEQVRYEPHAHAPHAARTYACTHTRTFSILQY